MESHDQCPKCGKPRKESDIDCPFCGIVYFKYEEIQKRKVEAPDPPKPVIPDEKKKKKEPLKPADLAKYMIIGTGVLWFFLIVTTGKGGWFKFILYLIAAWLIFSIMKDEKKKKRGNKGPMTTSGSRQKHKNFPPAPVDTNASINIKAEKISLALENLTNMDDFESSMEIVGSGNDIYIVDLKELTCTCPDFEKRREDFPVPDLRRLCKHQSRAIMDSGILTDVTRDRLVWSIIKNSEERGFVVYSTALKVTAEMDKKKPLVFYIFVQPGKAWLIILYEQHGSFGHFLFSATERRWAYKSNPFPTGYKIKGNTALNRVIDQHNLEEVATGHVAGGRGEEKIIWADPQNAYLTNLMKEQKG